MAFAGGGSAGGRITAGVGANLIGQHSHDRNQEATVYVGNLDEAVTDDLVWELFTQAGPVHNVYMPKDRITNKHQGYGFVEFKGEQDADYAIKVLNMIKLFGKPVRVNKASQDKKATDVGANLFVGNLDPDVDEKMLYDTFSAFGVIVATPKIMRDPDSGVSKGYGFVSYDSFEAADLAIEAMHGQFLMNRAITCGFAFKKDAHGERHGTPAERLLAASMRSNSMLQSRPHTIFSAGPGSQPSTQAPPDPLSRSNGMHAAQPPLPAPSASGVPPPPMPGLPPPPGPPQPAAPAAAAAPPWLTQPQMPQAPQMHRQPPAGVSGQMPQHVHGAAPPPPWAHQQQHQQQHAPPQMQMGPSGGHPGGPGGPPRLPPRPMHAPPGMGMGAPPPPWARPQGMAMHGGGARPPPPGMQPGMPMPPPGYSMAPPPRMMLPMPPSGQQAPGFPPRPNFAPRPVQY